MVSSNIALSHFFDMARVLVFISYIYEENL